MMADPKQTKMPIRNQIDPNKPVVLTDAQKEKLLEEASEMVESGHIAQIMSMTPEERENGETIFSIGFGAKKSLLFFGKDGVIESINGAYITEKARQLITYESTDTTLPNGKREGKGAKITINEQKEEKLYLKNFFNRIPYGIINKNRTGVGATTLEITSDRNSIIVMPTKNLAFSKATNKEFVTESGIYKCCYVGSKVKEKPKYKLLEIDEYLKEPEIEYRKFIVVADSLWKVIEAIGPSVYNDYFLMLDEIDSYQSDSTFRKSMGNALDYYFEFDHDNRCMVTATLQEFSNPAMNEEPVIELEYTDSAKRPVTLIHTDNPNAIVAEQIEKLYPKGGKIVIAYNKVQYIRQVIEGLSEELKDECAILCSEMSEPYAKPYFVRELQDNKLPKRINFITCTYFTGIDIEEKFHLLSVSNVDFHFSLLSADKYAQIAGRGRKGLLSEHIIYSTKPYGGKRTPNRYRDFLLEYASTVKDYINMADIISDKFNGLTDRSFLRVKEDIVQKSRVHYYKGSKIDVLRENVLTGEYEVAYLNIDALCEANRLRSQLYSSSNQLIKELKERVEIEDYIQMDRDVSEQQQRINEKVDNEFKEIDTSSLQTLIGDIREKYEASELDDKVLDKMRKEQTRKNQAFIDQFKKLYKYVPFDRLMEDLRGIAGHKKAFRGYSNAVIFWALADDHVFKTDMKAKFAEGAVYEKEEIKQKINAVYYHHFDREITSEVHVQKLGEYFKVEKLSSHKDEFKVVSYNKLGLEGNPLTTIPVDTDLRELGLIEFSGT